MPRAPGTGLLSKGYRYDRWNCGSDLWCAVLFTYRQNVCVCFTFVKLLVIPIGKASPAGSFLLSAPSLSALAATSEGDTSRRKPPGRARKGPRTCSESWYPLHVFSLYLNLLFPFSFMTKDGRRWWDQLYVLVKYCICITEVGIT